MKAVFGLASKFTTGQYMSQIVHKLKLTYHFREGVNCMLRYVLAQPVETDAMVILLLAAEYVGISKRRDQ